MRKLTLLIAAGSLWLFLAAVPALADGGPHVASKNSGTTTLTSDSCAGCHRAHTAQGPMIINATSEELLCVSCHGNAGTGATTNVQSGIQYALAATGLRGTGVAGALRSGGYEFARLSASNNISRKPYPRDGDSATPGVQVDISFSAQVPALSAGVQVTSTHMHLTGTADVTGPGKVWGNGAANSGAGPTVTMECVSCHNVHGNNQYRILNPVPDPASVTSGTFTAAATGITVADVRADPAIAAPTTGDDAGVRNYTVKWGATLADVVDNTFPNPDSATGDYWRRLQPYSVTPTWDGSAATITNPAGYFRGDIPEFIPTAQPGGSTTAASNTWRGTMSNWCAACHSRYHTAASGPNAYDSALRQVTNPNAVLPLTGPLAQTTNSGDSIFAYRHGTTNSECTQCHVSHGSNAAMPGAYSSTFPYPDNVYTAGVGSSVSASSRLLKVANRGTCQACHDPTGTSVYNGPTITQP